MALIEGGAFHCYKDGFETLNIDEWNKHCGAKEGDSTHITEEGNNICSSCKAPVQYSGVPFFPYDKSGSKNISIKCEDCAANEVKQKGKKIKKK